MTTRTMTAFLVAALIATVTSPCIAGTMSVEQFKAKQVALAWPQSLMRGDTDVTTALSAVPGAMDGGKTVKSTPELEKLLESVVEKKGNGD